MKPRIVTTLSCTTAIAALLLVAAPARAQTAYPPGPATTQPPAVNGNQDVGTVDPGETVTRELCGFAPNSAVRISVNGSFVTTLTADANGCVSVRFKVTSTSVVEVEGLAVTARCGANELAATGSQADGTPVNQTLSFEVACGAANGRTAFTGANIARGTITGAALVGVGALVVLGSRRRKLPQV